MAVVARVDFEVEGLVGEQPAVFVVVVVDFAVEGSVKELLVVLFGEQPLVSVAVVDFAVEMLVGEHLPVAVLVPSPAFAVAAPTRWEPENQTL